MKQTPIKLGPLALLLTVVCICLVTLSILNFTTSRADDSMSRRYADTVAIRQQLTAEGERFLYEADEQLANGGTLETTEQTFEQDGYTLTVRLTQTGDTYEIAQWRLEKQWEEKNEMDLWPGL